jgi:hypothetical protein
MAAMTASWRASTPQDVQDAFDALFSTVAPLAESTMSKRRQLAPLGAQIDAAGATSLAAALPPRGETSSAAIAALIIDGIRQTGDAVRAAVIVEDVTLTEMGTDAIRYSLEHRDGYALQIVSPYSISGGLKKRVEFSPYAVSLGVRRIWLET